MWQNICYENITIIFIWSDYFNLVLCKTCSKTTFFWSVFSFIQTKNRDSLCKSQDPVRVKESKD